MAKVTSKLQVTLPKALADEYEIRPGDDIDWLPAGDGIRVVKRSTPVAMRLDERLALFDAATARQRRRDKARPREPGKSRGWTREELYERGRTR